MAESGLSAFEKSARKADLKPAQVNGREILTSVGLTTSSLCG